MMATNLFYLFKAFVTIYFQPNSWTFFIAYISFLPVIWIYCTLTSIIAIFLATISNVYTYGKNSVHNIVITANNMRTIDQGQKNILMQSLMNSRWCPKSIAEIIINYSLINDSDDIPWIQPLK